MRNSIRTILFTCILSIVFLIITYLISVNKEIHFIQIESAWLSHDFLLTVFGGLFASTLVVLLCEIHRYCVLKENTEKYLFAQGVYLYQWLYQTDEDIQVYKDHTEAAIPENLLDIPENNLNQQISAIQNTEYTTIIHQDNSLMAAHQNFCTKDLMQMRLLLSGSANLRMKILQQKIGNIEKNQSNKTITSADPGVNQFLNGHQTKIKSALMLTDKYLQKIDDTRKGKFKWKETKKEIKKIFPHLNIHD